MFIVNEYISNNFDEINDVNGDGSLWELIYTIKNSQINFFVLSFDYIKDISTYFSISALFEPVEAIINKDVGNLWFQETILTDTTSKKYEITHGDDGKCRIIIPIARTSNRIKIKIAPDITDSGATDTLTVLGSENSIKGNR